MSRVPQQPATKGSQKWLQILINKRPDLLEKSFIAETKLLTVSSIDWLSPSMQDDYAEYRDEDFIQKLGVSLSTPLNTFWPALGPRWDGLGKTDQGHILLIEAKAHITEVAKSGTTAEDVDSVHLIEDSLRTTKAFFGSSKEIDWSKTFYQYTNRLAHLYFLRELNGLPAYLLNIYFVDDNTMDKPATRDEWESKLKLLKAELGINPTPLDKFCVDLFFDVKQL